MIAYYVARSNRFDTGTIPAKWAYEKYFVVQA
jgi:hypothetical protein